MITDSTGPAVTTAVRIRARLSDGRIQPGSQMIRTANSSERQADARQRAAFRLRLNFGSQLAIHGPAHIKACAGDEPQNQPFTALRSPSSFRSARSAVQ